MRSWEEFANAQRVGVWRDSDQAYNNKMTHSSTAKIHRGYSGNDETSVLIKLSFAAETYRYVK